MIIVDDVYKRYQTDHGRGKWVLQGVSLTIPPKTNVGLIGRNGAGKSTLLRIIGGVDNPTRGRVERQCRVSWPMGFGGGLQGSLTGRQNAKFICRIHGHQDDIPERLTAIQAFAEIGEAFDEPVKTYSSGMKSRLQFALSLAFDFDVYISDEVTSTGDAAFRKKASDAFKSLVDRAGLIMVAHGEGILKEFCTAGIWLNEGKAHWFDDINDALKAYRESIGTQAAPAAQTAPKPAAAKPVQAAAQAKAKPADRKNAASKAHGDVPPTVTPNPATNQHPKLKMFGKSLDILTRGINGKPMEVNERAAQRIVRHARQMGIELLTEEAIIAKGIRLKKNAVPILMQAGEQGTVSLYDLHTQCIQAEVAND